MRLILERDEIIKILGKHFDADLDPDNVTIRTDPFEIEVQGLPLSSSDPEPRESNVVSMRPPTPVGASGPRTPGPAPIPAAARDDSDTSTDPPPPGLDGSEPGPADVHPAAVLAASKALEQELDRENPQLNRRRSGSFSHNPPTDQSKEI